MPDCSSPAFPEHHAGFLPETHIALEICLRSIETRDGKLFDSLVVIGNRFPYADRPLQTVRRWRCAHPALGREMRWSDRCIKFVVPPVSFDEGRDVALQALLRTADELPRTTDWKKTAAFNNLLGKRILPRKNFIKVIHSWQDP